MLRMSSKEISHMTHLVTKNKVVTAATNGSIVLWDINKATGRRAGIKLEG